MLCCIIIVITIIIIVIIIVIVIVIHYYYHYYYHYYHYYYHCHYYHHYHHYYHYYHHDHFILLLLLLSLLLLLLLMLLQIISLLLSLSSLCIIYLWIRVICLPTVNSFATNFAIYYNAKKTFIVFSTWSICLHWSHSCDCILTYLNICYQSFAHWYEPIFALNDTNLSEWGMIYASILKLTFVRNSSVSKEAIHTIIRPHIAS